MTEKKSEVKRKSDVVRFPLIKPKDNRIAIINLRTGKVRVPRVGEVGIQVIDPYSNPSLEDGDLVLPKKKVTKHGKEKVRV